MIGALDVLTGVETMVCVCVSMCGWIGLFSSLRNYLGGGRFFEVSLQSQQQARVSLTRGLQRGLAALQRLQVGARDWVKVRVRAGDCMCARG